MIYSRKELLDIQGGSISATMINAIVRGFQFLFEVGKSVGSSISRMISKNYC